MLLGCCHCGQQGSEPVPSVESIIPPSGSAPSILFPSDSNASILPPDVSPVCGACYNFPTKWKVTFNNDWFVYNPGGGLGFPSYEDCQPITTLTEYTLYYKSANYDPGGDYPVLCSEWQSSTAATNLSQYPCDPEDPLFPTCGPDTQNRRRVTILAYKWDPTTTLFYLTYSWTHCEYIFTYRWRWWVARPTGNTISCVRSFEAAQWDAVTSYPNPGVPFPYFFSTTNTGWQNIIVEPA